jgi:hypothetical protein
MGTIKHLSFANLLYKGEIEFVGASEGQLSNDGGKVLALMDSTAIIEKLSASHAFQEAGMLKDAVTKDPAFAKALSDPFSAEPALLASLTNKAGADGLLWVGREYRIRAMRAFKGDRYAKWMGEVVSRLYVFDRTGHLTLRVAWVDETDTKYQGDEINSTQAIPLLTASVDQAAQTVANILGQAVSGHGIPQGLRTESKIEASQQMSGIAHDVGAIGRVLLLVVLIAIAWGTLTAEGVGIKGIGLLFCTGVLYLLVGRGWWKDAVLQVLDLIKEAIFG